MVENVVLGAFPFLENGTLRNGNADSPNPDSTKNKVLSLHQSGTRPPLFSLIFGIFEI